MGNLQRAVLFATTALCCAGSAQPLLASQQQNAPTVSPPSPGETEIRDTANTQVAQDNALTSAETYGEAIVVTGSRIRSGNVESISPIIQIDAEEFTTRGTVRAEDLVNQIPSVFAAQGSAASNEATGTAQVDLRGLGASRTLVLVNGRRLPYGSPQSVPSDINQVPTPLIRSVEVLTGGASAVYGSDAIAGVVNFQLVDDFEGLKLTANIGAYQHNNDDDNLRSLLDSNSIAKPGGSEWNGLTQEYSAIVGSNFQEGRGNITAYGTYRKVNAISQSDYDYSACALAPEGPDGADFSCGGSSYNNPSNFANTAFLPNVPSGFRTEDGQFLEGREFFNYAPFNYYQRPDERYTLGAMGHYELNEHVIPYFELSYVDDRSVAQIAPGTVSGGISGQSGNLNCDNAFLSAQQGEFLCGAAGLSTASIYDAAGNYVGPEDIATGISLQRRFVEGGPRQDNLHLGTFRVVGGVRGDIDSVLSYDVFASYANVNYDSRFVGNVSFSKLGNALNAVVDRRPGSATNGQIVCAINADASSANDATNCAPLDLISGGTASQAGVDYVSQSQSIVGTTALTNIVGSISGDLGGYGIKSPFADSGIGIAIGFEYRKNTLDLNPDEAYQQSATPQFPVNGEVSANELFAEINIPLVENVPGFELLSVEGAYRYSDYDIGFQTDTYKAGANWSPFNSMRIRGSYQRAVRAPNVIELFSSQQPFEVELTQNANGSFDPCAGEQPFATLQQCINTGVTAAQYGNILDNPSGQFNALIGGNLNLQPEVADTFSLGVVFEPAFIPRFTASVDYFDITVDRLIGSLNPNLALRNCLSQGDPAACATINRGAGGTLYLDNSGFFERINLNTGSLTTSGIDVSLNYRLPTAAVGAFSFNFVGTYLDSFETTPLPNSPEEDIYDCTGLYAGLCGRPRPEWRHKFLTNWSTPFGLDLFATWRYTSSVKIAQTSDQPALKGSFAQINEKLGSRSYIDFAAGYDLVDNVRLTAGVNNVFDENPPLTTTAAIEDGGNGNTYPQFYDSTGRYFFTSVAVKF